VNGGTGNYSYLWSNGATSASITGLVAGTYTVNVTDNTTGCTTSCSVTIAGSNAITCSVVGTDATCGTSNGTATVNVNGGSGNYTYSWNNGGNTATLTGLAAGTYSVNVTDNNSGCTTTCSVTIGGGAAITCSVTGTDAACGNANGTATATVNGGSGNYSYVWNNGATTSSISGLPAGTYSVNVTDNSSGCTTLCSVTIGGGSAITCSTSGTDATCGLANGSATATISGGSGNYTYSWSNGGSTATITGLAPGTYVADVTDNATGCTTSCTVVVQGTGMITCSVSGTNANCGDATGTATASVNGGSGNYSYLWNNGATTPTITGLVTGTYSVNITDNVSGCTTSCSVNVGGGTALACSITSSPENCGLANGTATVSASGGNGNYTYAWSNGANTSVATGLATGTYSVTITDTNGCSTSCTVDVSSTDAPTCVITGTNASCTSSLGSAFVTVTGGAGNYTYAWSNGETTQSISNLPIGTYSVFVTDGAGCQTSCSVVIGQDDVPVCTTSSEPANCGANNGVAVVTTVGGSGGYTYEWSNGGTTSSISGLIAGIYSVTVTDTEGCSTTCSVEVDFMAPTACEIVVQDAQCGQSNGIATVIATGGVGNYTYLWNTGDTVSEITGLSGGTYSVTVTDDFGCSTVCEAIITDNGSGPICSITGTDATCGNNNGTVQVMVTGGVTPYTYAWSNGSTTPMISGLIGGNYTVTVTDDAGCSSICSTSIESIGGPACSIDAVDANCGNSDGRATANATGGTGIYSYMWSNGETTSTVFNLLPGAYSVTITDEKGCQVVCTAEIENSLENCNAEVGNYVWEDLDGDGIQDAGEPGIPGVVVTLYNAVTNAIVETTTTDANGEYCFTGLTPNDYYIGYMLPSTMAGYVNTLSDGPMDGLDNDVTGANGPNTTSNFTLDQSEVNKTIDAGFYQGASLGNQVWCDSEENSGGIPNVFDGGDTPIEGAIINLYSIDFMTGIETFVATTVTNQTGNYLFSGLQAGNYIVEIDYDGSKRFVSPNVGGDDTRDSDIVEIMNQTGSNVKGRTGFISLSPGQSDLTTDIGLTDLRALSIEVFDFYGEWNKDRSVSELFWITETEVNSDYFIVERSESFDGGYESIGKVDAAGNSTARLYYDLEDDQIIKSGIYYYRLQLVDLDGSYEYSDPISINVEFDNEGEQKISVEVYPNPFVTTLTINIDVERETEIEGGFYDAIGQLIKKVNSQTIPAGATSLGIDTNDLPAGTYILRVAVDEQVIIEKISKN
jgi:hypothetical protein